MKGIYKKPELDGKIDKQTRWSTCHISGQPLEVPIAADFLGTLYNKEAVLEFLLARNGYFADQEAEHRYLNQLRASGNAFDHLRTKNDVFAVNLEMRGATSGSERADGGARCTSDYRCPVTDLPCLGNLMSALPACGHVFSDRAIAQMTEQACSICSRPFSEECVVPIHGTPDQIEGLRSRLQARREALKGRMGRKRKLGALACSSGSPLEIGAFEVADS